MWEKRGAQVAWMVLKKASLSSLIFFLLDHGLAKKTTFWSKYCMFVTSKYY